MIDFIHYLYKGIESQQNTQEKHSQLLISILIPNYLKTM